MKPHLVDLNSRLIDLILILRSNLYVRVLLPRGLLISGELHIFVLRIVLSNYTDIIDMLVHQNKSLTKQCNVLLIYASQMISVQF